MERKEWRGREEKEMDSKGQVRGKDGEERMVRKGEGRDGEEEIERMG